MLRVDRVEYVHIVTPTSSLVLGSSIGSLLSSLVIITSIN